MDMMMRSVSSSTSDPTPPDPASPSDDLDNDVALQLIKVLEGVIQDLDEQAMQAVKPQKVLEIPRMKQFFRKHSSSNGNASASAAAGKDAEGTKDPPTARLGWCVKVLESLRESGCIRSDRDPRDSFEHVERRLKAGFRTLSRGSSKDKNIAHWMETTYTDGLSDERRKLSQERFSMSAKGAHSDMRHNTFDVAMMRSHSGHVPAPLVTRKSSSALNKDLTRVSDSRLRSHSDPPVPVPPSPPHQQQQDQDLQSLPPPPPPLQRMSTQERIVVTQFNDGMSRADKQGIATAEPMALRLDLRPLDVSQASSKGPPSLQSSPSTFSLDTRFTCLDSSSVGSLTQITEVTKRKLARSFKKTATTLKSVMPIPSEECTEHLKDTDNWAFDIFRLHDLSHGRPLTTLGMKFLHDRGLIASLKLDAETCARFFTEIENRYGRFPVVRYHNNTHGADVMHSVHVMLDTPTLQNAFSELEIFTALLAGAVHDVEHPGRTNSFLVKTGAPLALLYNDTSVLENHHVATASSIMETTRGCNILQNFDAKDKLIIRKMLIDMVLSTDMVKHTKFLGEFRALLKKTHDFIKDPSSNLNTIKDNLAKSYEDRLLVLCNIVHSADLGGSAKPWNICQEWTDRIVGEFWDEGDEERRLGLDIGAMNDREKVIVPKAQVGYINFICLPLWEAWGEYVEPGAEIIQLKHLRENLKCWQDQVNALEKDEAGSTPASLPASKPGSPGKHLDGMAPHAETSEETGEELDDGEEGQQSEGGDEADAANGKHMAAPRASRASSRSPSKAALAKNKSSYV